MMTFPIYGKMKNMFQTTNQLSLEYLDIYGNMLILLSNILREAIA